MDYIHMYKLLRNALATYKVFHWPGEGYVKWEYLELLVDEQSHHGLRLANKLTQEHIDFQHRKMSVRLAVQVN